MQFLIRKSRTTTISVFILALAITIGTLSSCTRVEIAENERGVKFEKYNDGLNPDIIYQPGSHLLLLWDRMYVYKIDNITRSDYFRFTIADDLSYEVKMAITYHVIPDRTGYLHLQFGINYFPTAIVKPIDLALRERLSGLPDTAIIKLDTDALEKEIQQTVSEPIMRQYIRIIDVQILDVYPID